MAREGVAIVGTGISGTTLALRLQQLGIEATLYGDRPAAAHAQGRLPNTVVRFEHTLARERAIGVDHAAFEEATHRAVHFDIAGPMAFGFVGQPEAAYQAVDFRVLIPHLLEAYEARGGRYVGVAGAPLGSQLVAELSATYELVVVAVGRGSLTDLFPRDDARSPLDAPQRLLLAAFFHGLQHPEPRGLSFNISPGCGEIFQLPIWTRHGLVNSLLLEAIPGGPLEALATADTNDTTALVRAYRDVLADHAPAIADRLTPTFDLTDPLDVLQGAVTPTVRRSWARLPDGGLAVAIGDAWIANDPITGQGANIGSHCAWVAADLISHGPPFDEAFAARLDDAMWSFAGPVSAWTNAFLAPPPDYILELLVAAGSNQAVADRFVSLFNDPVAMASITADPARTAELAASGGGQPAEPTQA